jgi:DNA-binding transcriptional regulator PaaX
MKTNTKKLLTWLYSTAEQTAYVTDYSQLELILPDMTEGGRRSLVHYLSQKHLIRSERLGEKTSISLTSHGMDALTVQFPVFSPALQQWDGKWSALVFLNGPKGDLHFRYLRQLLLDQHAFCLTRGMYLYPGEFPSQITNVCKDMYVGAVMMIKIEEWRFGDERELINQHYMLSDLVEIFSGISSEINQLLRVKKEQKRLTKKSRSLIFSVFDRLFNVLSQDPGFIHHYYPDVPSVRDLLAQLHSIMELD